MKKNSFTCLAIMALASTLAYGQQTASQETPAKAASETTAEQAKPAAEQAKPAAEQDLLGLSLDEILNMNVAVSSSTAKTLFQTPSSVTVLDRQMLKAYNFLSVSEALSIVPGFSIWRTYQKRDLPTARGILQDHYANKVLVMINGMPSWNAVTGEPTLDRVDINDVERIEILKGPASVLYGTNAYAGAVNIVLRNQAAMPGGDAYLRLGNWGLYQGGGNYSLKRKDVSLFVAANAAHAKGYDYQFKDERRVERPLKEYTYGSNFTAVGSYKHHSFFINGFNFHESFLGATPNFSAGAGKDQVTDGYLAGYSLSLDPLKALRLRYSLVYDWNQRDHSRSADDRVRSTLAGYSAVNRLQTDWNISEKVTLSAGLEHAYRRAQKYRNYDTVDNRILETNNLEDRSSTELSGFAELEYQSARLALSAGTRYTHNSIFGENVSSRVTAVLPLDSTNSLKFIVGQAFRAPSFFEQYFKTSTGTVFGSLDLEPEKSTSYELAYLTSFRQLFSQVLVYHADYDSRISRIRSDDLIVYANGKPFSANGLEIETRLFRPEIVNFLFNYAWVAGNAHDEVNNDGNYNFRYVPRHTFSAGIEKQYKGLSLSGMTHFLSRMSGYLAPIPAQATADIGVNYRFHFWNQPVVHSFAVKNITNANVLLPEYVRRGTLNAVPAGLGRHLVYTIGLAF